MSFAGIAGMLLLACLALFAIPPRAGAQATAELGRRGVSSARPLNPITSSTSSGVAPVVFGALLGGVATTAAWAVPQFGSDAPGRGSFPLVWGSGAALGAVIGAAVGDRKAAPAWTVLGAAVATLPLVALGPEGDEWGGAIVVVLSLPIAGAVVGNTLGQTR